MSSTKYDKMPEPGDLIEIFRGFYQHWAVYVGDGYVIHLETPSEHAQAGDNSLMGILHDKATVRKEGLYKVVGNDKYRINNLLDDKFEPRPIQDIPQDAHSLLGKEYHYNLLTWNCEHFVTELRYGKPQSRQPIQCLVNPTKCLIDATSAIFGPKDGKNQK